MNPRAQQKEVSTSMLLVNCSSSVRWDALYSRRSILTTMDITTDGFGFMLAFGDLSWVPSRAQAPWLPGVLRCSIVYLALVLITLLHFTGYVVFRGANSQKTVPEGPAPAIDEGTTFLQTKRVRNSSRRASGAPRARSITGDGSWGSPGVCCASVLRSPTSARLTTPCSWYIALRDDHARAGATAQTGRVQARGARACSCSAWSRVH